MESSPKNKAYWRKNLQYLVALNFIVSIAVAAVTPSPPDDVQALVDDIRVP